MARALMRDPKMPAWLGKPAESGQLVDFLLGWQACYCRCHCLFSRRRRRAAPP